MNHKIASTLAIALACLVLGLAGCSEVEPKTGTRITFSMPANAVSRKKINELCIYLLKRSHQMLAVEAPRVESVDRHSLVLLLPGKKLSRQDAEKLVVVSSIELYQLKNVATEKAPNRPWTMKRPSVAGGVYLFLGPDAKRVDSRENPHDLLVEVVGYPNQKPIITGKNIEPNASITDVKSGWAVLVQFDEKGARKFYDFTKNNVGEYLAVFYNGDLISAPVVEGPIQEGKAFITGFKSHDEAQAAVDEINAGQLPVEIRVKTVETY